MNARHAICEFELVSIDCVRLIVTEPGVGVVDIEEYPPDPRSALMMADFNGYRQNRFGNVDIKCAWDVDFGRTKTVVSRFERVLAAALDVHEGAAP